MDQESQCFKQVTLGSIEPVEESQWRRARSEHSLSKAEVKHDRAWSRHGWVTTMR